MGSLQEQEASIDPGTGDPRTGEFGSGDGPESRPVVLTTDFGLDDPYVGVMKGVILGINPGATLVDLTHNIQPQNVSQAAFVLGNSYRFFPAAAIHVAVVDPGVGTARRAVLLITPRGWFVAPDNGVLSYVLRDFINQIPDQSPDQPPNKANSVKVPTGLKAFNLTEARYWLHPVSRTFHGRDVFAPVAAHLSLGVAPEEMGEPVDDLVWLPAPQPVTHRDHVDGQVVNVDHFGNLVTNIPAAALADTENLVISIRGRRVFGLSDTFNDRVHGPSVELVALVGSNGLLEVAVPNGSAATLLDASIGEPVTAFFSISS